MANMRNLGYKTDWSANTFTMTKRFAEMAQVYGSKEYQIVLNARSKGFIIIVRESKPRAACPTRISYKKMENHLSCLDNADERLAQLHTVMDDSKSHGNPYEYVRRWFLTNYPNFRDIPVLNTDCRIIGPRIKYALEDPEFEKIPA